MRRLSVFGIALVLFSQGFVWAGETAKSKESYVKKAEGEVQEWTVKLKSLQDRSEKSGSKTRHEFDRDMKSVNEAFESVRKNLQALRVSSGESSKGLRRQLEESLREVKQDYRQLMSFFDKKETKEKS